MVDFLQSYSPISVSVGVKLYVYSRVLHMLYLHHKFYNQTTHRSPGGIHGCVSADFKNISPDTLLAPIRRWWRFALCLSATHFSSQLIFRIEFIFKIIIHAVCCVCVFSSALTPLNVICGISRQLIDDWPESVSYVMRACCILNCQEIVCYKL